LRGISVEEAKFLVYKVIERCIMVHSQCGYGSCFEGFRSLAGIRFDTSNPQNS